MQLTTHLAATTSSSEQKDADELLLWLVNHHFQVDGKAAEAEVDGDGIGWDGLGWNGIW